MLRKHRSQTRCCRWTLALMSRVKSGGVFSSSDLVVSVRTISTNGRVIPNLRMHQLMVSKDLVLVGKKALSRRLTTVYRHVKERLLSWRQRLILLPISHNIALYLFTWPVSVTTHTLHSQGNCSIKMVLLEVTPELDLMRCQSHV